MWSQVYEKDVSLSLKGLNIRLTAYNGSSVKAGVILLDILVNWGENMAIKRKQAPRRGAQYASLLQGDEDDREPQQLEGGRHSRRPYNPSVGAYATSTSRTSAGAGKGPALIATVVFSIMALGGLWFWLHRAVLITVNGEATRIAINTTIDAARNELGVSVTPGNLVAVDGSILETGTGEPYSLMVNGEKKSLDEAKSWHLQGGEELEFETGADRMEEYSVELNEIAPKLEIDGNGGSISYVAQWGRPRQQEKRTGTISGLVADGDVVDEGQNCIVKTITPTPEADKQLVALTFDDGPSAYTQRYLEILNSYDAHATFFTLATEVKEMPEIARAITTGGSELMSHTNQHLDLTTLEPSSLVHEITTAAAIIDEATGVKTSSIRPPYGEFNAQSWLASQGNVSLTVLWTQDSEDWRRQGVGTIVDKALSGVRSGSIILMHDGGGNRDMDLEALPQIIESLQADGYSLVTISELLAACPDIPPEIASGYAPMPAGAAWPTEMA